MPSECPEPATPAGDDADLLRELDQAIIDALGDDAFFFLGKLGVAARAILPIIHRREAAAHAAGRAAERAEVTALIGRNLMSPQRYLDATERGDHEGTKGNA